MHTLNMPACSQQYLFFFLIQLIFQENKLHLTLKQVQSRLYAVCLCNGLETSLKQHINICSVNLEGAKPRGRVAQGPILNVGKER